MAYESYLPNALSKANDLTGSQYLETNEYASLIEAARADNKDAQNALATARAVGGNAFKMITSRDAREEGYANLGSPKV